MSSMSFTCAECGDPAATVMLVAPTNDPKEIGGDEWKIDVDGPVPTTHWILRNLEDVRRAMADRSVEALGRINPEYVNFRCPDCSAIYCKKHWEPIVPMMDEGFYDMTFGICPRGHRQILDD